MPCASARSNSLVAPRSIIRLPVHSRTLPSSEYTSASVNQPAASAKSLLSRYKALPLFINLSACTLSIPQTKAGALGKTQ